MISKRFYGTTSGGKTVEEYTLTNAVEIRVITYGGIVTSIFVTAP
jgi:hypothetical protein